jgi:hypothetical protein
MKFYFILLFANICLISSYFVRLIDSSSPEHLPKIWPDIHQKFGQTFFRVLNINYQNFGQTFTKILARHSPKIWPDIYQKFGQTFTKNLARHLPKIWPDIHQKFGPAFP